jgi:kynureninase
MIEIQSIFNSPNILEEHYSDFGVSTRILLTGHSHQAWPNVAFDGVKKCWDDAAKLVDNKWERALEKADEVSKGFLNLMNDKSGLIALSANTHDLLLRFLSALDWKNRTKIITTDLEFHTVRRQLDRLAEDWVEIIKVPAMPVETLS